MLNYGFKVKELKSFQYPLLLSSLNANVAEKFLKEFV